MKNRINSLSKISKNQNLAIESNQQQRKRPFTNYNKAPPVRLKANQSSKQLPKRNYQNVQRPSQSTRADSSQNFVFPSAKEQLENERRQQMDKLYAQAPYTLTTPKNAKPSIDQFVTQVEVPKSTLQEDANRIYKDHLFQTFQALKFVKWLPEVDPQELASKKIYLRKVTTHRKLIIFDLDETLVHCTEDLVQADVTLPITFPNGETVSAGINIRPFVTEWLRAATQLYEVAVFTASHKCYADAVLDHIDPTDSLIHHRLYRDQCVQVDGIFIKDLRIFTNWNLKDVILIDNAAYSFGYQLNNGIPIISWTFDKNDRELYNLQDYMKVLATAPDIRQVNERTFRLKTFYDDYIAEFMK